MFFISIPNPKRWDFSLGIRNYWDFPPNHLMPVWSQKSLEIALEKVGLRRKGYFVGLTSEVLETKSIFKMHIKVLYRELEKINIIAKFISWPFLQVITIIFKRKGYSGLSALALAQPV